MNDTSRWLPGVVVALGGLYLLLVAVPSGTTGGQYDLDAFGKLPVMDRGRLKPLDTVARVDLMVISDGKQTYKDDEGKAQPAIKWLLEVMTSGTRRNGKATKLKVFRVDNLELLGLLGLEIRPGSYRYSVEEIAPKFMDLSHEADRARQKNSKQRTVFEAKCLELEEHLRLYQDLANVDGILLVPNPEPGKDWLSYGKLLAVARHIAESRVTEQAKRAGIDPAKMSDEEFFTKLHAELEGAYAALPAPVKGLREILEAYRAGRPERFNQAVAEYHRQLDELPGADSSTVPFEAFFNKFDAFSHCSWLYFAVFLLASASWLVFGAPLSRAAFWLAVLTFVVHTWALGARMYIQGRPPVTNLYSAAVYVGWVCLLLALILERIFDNGLAVFVGGLAGFATMRLALFLGGAGDTLEMMQAVLDTNFWLATHVTIVTAGYGATLVAGVLGAVYIVLGVFTRKLDKGMAAALAKMIYGTICFATLLSFTGTVLGGIWADQSWGRFWGWDPKENGALIIVIWNALILHARWAGMVKQRGMAVLSIVGNIVTGWSMLGTNQLGVGLHAYGFSEALALLLRWFWVGNIALIGVGLMPLTWWQSFATPAAPEPPKPAPRAKGKLTPAR